MKYIRLRAWLTILVLIVGVFLLLYYSSSSGTAPFKSDKPITDSLLTSAYPDLYEALVQRDSKLLKPFLSHQHPEVRAQAWRAFAQTPVQTDALIPFITLAKEQNLQAAWLAVSKKDLSDSQLRILEEYWVENPELRSGVSRVLGQQGDEQTFDFLLNRIIEAKPKYEYHFALAIGRLTERLTVDQDQQIRIIQNAFDTENYDATRAYLYGWYRGDESRLTDAAQDTLFRRWSLMGAGLSRNVDQYVNKILPRRTTHTLTIYYNGQQLLDDKIQLAYELATSVGKVAIDDKNSLTAKILLTNKNPHVQVRTLQSLQKRLEIGGDLYGYIRDEMLSDSGLADEVWLHALKVVQAVEPAVISEYESRLQKIAEDNPYLLTDALNIYAQYESADKYLKRIKMLVADKDPLQVMYALQSLNRFVENADRLYATQVRQVRSIVFDALDLEDRGIHYMIVSLLEREQLFDTDDFDRINKSLRGFSLPEDIEVYQTFGTLYKQRFEYQAQQIIDSLASKKYAPLNRTLAEAGWNVEVRKDTDTDFRLPDWQRLWELGRTPIMRINTNKGRIDIQLNTLSAPATVAMLDSLTRSRAYKGVPFHRVVPNFVIQGGDVERQDGFGGPDFVILSEISEKEFNRGAAGIASAGTDTEGSQYFIMHQWMPHLNGNYTRFGQVVNGMDIVDRITVGDKVLSVEWITSEQADSVF